MVSPDYGSNAFLAGATEHRRRIVPEAARDFILKRRHQKSRKRSRETPTDANPDTGGQTKRKRRTPSRAQAGTLSTSHWKGTTTTSNAMMNKSVSVAAAIASVTAVAIAAGELPNGPVSTANRFFSTDHGAYTLSNTSPTQPWWAVLVVDSLNGTRPIICKTRSPIQMRFD